MDHSVLSARGLIGNPVKNSQGEPIGRIEELIIDPESGKIAGAVLSREKVKNGDNRLATVPWASMTVSPSDGVIYVDGDLIEHPLRRERDWAGASEIHWSSNVVVYTSSIYKGSGENK